MNGRRGVALKPKLKRQNFREESPWDLLELVHAGTPQPGDRRGDDCEHDWREKLDNFSAWGSLWPVGNNITTRKCQKCCRVLWELSGPLIAKVKLIRRAKGSRDG